MKVCRRCKVEKPATEFSKNPRYSDGLGQWCHPCHAAYQRERKVKVMARAEVACRTDEEFGIWLKSRRMAIGLAASDAARLARIDTQRLVDIEYARERGATMRECVAIATVLKLDASDVIRRAGGEVPVPFKQGVAG